MGCMGVDNFWRVGGLGVHSVPQIFVAMPTSCHHTYFTLGCACNDFKKVVIYNSHSFCKLFHCTTVVSKFCVCQIQSPNLGGPP